MTAAFQPFPSRDGDDDQAEADRRAWYADFDTALLGPLPTSGNVPAPAETAGSSIDIADVGTTVLAPPDVLVSIAEWNRKWAEDHAREARRLRAEANGMEINLDDLRATRRRYVDRRDVLLDYSHLSDDERRELARLEDKIVEMDRVIADIRACMISVRQVAREHEAATQALRAAVAPSASGQQGR